MTDDTEKTDSGEEEKLGKVIFYLLKENHLTRENIHYARRIQKKTDPSQGAPRSIKGARICQ